MGGGGLYCGEIYTSRSDKERDYREDKKRNS